MDPDDQLSLRRDDLRMGKYTEWAAELSADELQALLWMVGEYGIRASVDPSEDAIGSHPRGEAGRQALVGFVRGRPLSMEQALARIREAGAQPPSSTV